MLNFKNLCLLIGGLFFASMLFSQNIDCTRTAVLKNGAYQMSGTAYLERFDNGTMQLRLGSDFQTQSGPDVQVFLSNDSTSSAGGVMLADIGTTDGLSHFSGEISFPVTGVSIDQYKFVVFRCVTFAAFWGGGRLGVASCDDSGGGGGGMDSTIAMLCKESIVATTNWESEVTICPNDGFDDIVPLINTDRTPAGDSYAYIFADANNNIKQLHFADSYNFEGSSLEADYIFGVSYRGTLSYNIGEPITSITSDSCAMVSSLTTFLTVRKENCQAIFDCTQSITATTNWGTLVDICPGDGTPDMVPFLNNQFQEPGEHYVYLITDTLNRLVKVHDTSSYDFDDSGTSPNRVFGLSYAGTLNYNLGDHITAITADSCFHLSDTTLYLTITKNACVVNPSVFSIAGKVLTSLGTPIIGAEVRLNNGMTTLSDENGAYLFENVSGNQDYNIKAYHDAKPSNGISSTDLVLTARHILNYITFTDPFQLMAADVNNNGSISAGDLVQMKRVLLGFSPSFSNNTSWRFFDANQNLQNPSEMLTEIITITLTENMAELNFIGVKIGDVNGNAGVDLR